MRILHVNKFLHRRGGAEGYMLDLAELQRDQGHEVGFFGMDHPDNDQVSQGTPASYVEFDPAPAGVLARAHLVGRMIWSRSARQGMDEALDAFRPDVVHAHNIYHQLSPVGGARGRAGAGSRSCSPCTTTSSPARPTSSSTTASPAPPA